MLRITMLNEEGRRVLASIRVFDSGMEAIRFLNTIPPEREPQVESVWETPPNGGHT